MRYAMLKFIILLKIIIVKSEIVKRRFDNDEFSQSQNIKCDDGISSYKISNDVCTCKRDKTFFLHEKQNCFIKEEISSLAGDCHNSFVTISETQIPPINSCALDKLISIDVWDFNNISSWKTHWHNHLSMFITAKKGARGIMINNNIGNWDGLLLRIKFICDTGSSHKCMIVKFTGERQYPLQDKILEKITQSTTKNPETNTLNVNISSTALSESETTLVTHTSTVSIETTTTKITPGEEITTTTATKTITNIREIKTIDSSLITLSGLTTDANVNKAFNTTQTISGNKDQNIYITEHYRTHKQGDTIRKVVAVTISIVLLTLILLIILFVKHR